MDEKDKIPVNKITGKNTPNDDEEILKQGDKDMEATIKSGKQNSQAKKNEAPKDSQNIGIP